MTIYYVVGFVVCPEIKRVLLIEKQKPKWQNGSLNGIGGKVEGDESPIEAMTRECKEETGLVLFEWTKFASMKGTDTPDEYFVHCLMALVPKIVYEMYETVESERIVDIDLNDFYKIGNLLGNIPWLVGMGLDFIKNGAVIAPPTIEYSDKKSLPIHL